MSKHCSLKIVEWLALREKFTLLRNLLNQEKISQANMADNTQALMGQVAADSLVERITVDVLKAVEDSFDKKINLVLKKLEACSSKIATLDTQVTEAERRISNSEDATAIHITRLSEVESKLEVAMDKISDLENRSWRCNICVVVLTEGSEGANLVAFFKIWLAEIWQDFPPRSLLTDSLPPFCTLRATMVIC